MDDTNWPINDMNVLTFGSEVPWPDWWEYSVYQSLVTVDLNAEYQQGVTNYIPMLASNWTVSADHTTYTFNLRNVTFSNGDPVTSYGYWLELYGFYFLSANSSAWYQSYDVYDMSHVNFGPSTIALISKSGVINPSQDALKIMQDTTWPIYVTGPHTIVFHLKTPFLWFFGTLVSYEGMVFDTQFVLQNGGFGAAGSVNPYFNQHAIPGTGPYYMSGISENSWVSFQQNPSYWGNSLTPAQIAANPALDPGHVKKAIINYKPDDVARFTDVSTGAAQIVAIQAANWPLVIANPDKYAYTVMPPWSAQISAIALNMNLYPTNITAVRQALVHSLNYSDIIQKAFFGQVARGMGPEYASWKDYYDLGNYQPYDYNITLAQQILAQNHIDVTKFPTFSFRTVAGCSYCINVAQIVQADLAQIGITVNIDVLAGSAYWAPYGSYSTNKQNAAQIGQLSLLGGEVWAPSAVTPADNWVSFVSNSSVWGNWAGYNNPDVQACVHAFTSNADATQIKAICTKAQGTIYNEAPYAWIGFYSLWYEAGSLVWQKGVVKNFYLDPAWNGIDTMPLINTVTFG